MKKQYIGLHGFKNNAPAYARKDPWTEVQLFLDTWGFLPSENNILEKLSKDSLIRLCILSLSATSIIDLEGRGIKAIQELMHDLDISPEKLKT